MRIKREMSSQVISTSLAGLMTVAVIAVPLMSGSVAEAEHVVDFTTGSYDTWDGTTYTFDWYENPSVDAEGRNVYTISSASDLAGLSVVTNNLSGAEFATITANIAAEDAQYIATVDTFENATVTLACDIDLANLDWMPISYPWFTANLSSAYDINTPSGDVVHYNAVDHVPELETVDPWVGDVNGNPISTRYWELPESEMRFRDLIQPLSFEKMNELVTMNYEDPKFFNGEFNTIDIRSEDDKTVTKFTMEGYSIPSIIKVEYEYDYGVHDDLVNYQYDTDLFGSDVTFVKNVDYDREVVVSYTYKDIKDFTENKGFSGKFDGAGYKVNNVHPDTPWTSDATQRLHTYDPIGKGLFGLLSETGSINNLSVRGSYNDTDVCSYSAILCAYNYGTIDGCYIEGNMEQGLIKMIYPIARDYSPDHNSTYEYSTEAGTVMPVGNSGFVTAVNNGVISNSYTVGEVTQAYRQFGFFACTNNGTIINCENRANFSTHEIKTDFTTDEWSYSTPDSHGHVLYTRGFEVKGVNTGTSVKGYYSTDFGASGSTFCAFASVHTDDDGEVRATAGSFLDFSDPDTYPLSFYLPEPERNTFLYYLDCRPESFISHLSSSMAFASYSALSSEGHAIADAYDDNAWLPALYNTDTGESIAANHLYGVYSETVVGGICAVNKGTVERSINKAEIKAMGNTSPRNTFVMKTGEDTRDALSYIRPSNQYGIFSTCVSVENLSGGISGLNIGKLLYCSNKGIIVDRELTELEKHVDGLWVDTEYKLHGVYMTDSVIYDFIPCTRNDFYVNGAFYTDSDGNKKVNAFNNKWMVNDAVIENTRAALDAIKNIPDDDYAGKRDALQSLNIIVANSNEYMYMETLLSDLEEQLGVMLDVYDRNMPYPATVDQAALVYQMSGGITGKNTGLIQDCDMTGTANNGITALSRGITEIARIDNADVDTENLRDSNICDLAYDSSVDYCEVTGVMGVGREASTDLEKQIVNYSSENIKFKENDYIAGLVNTFVQDKFPVSCTGCSVYRGNGAFQYAVGTDLTISDLALYGADTDTAYGVADAIIGADIKNVANFQKSEYGLARTENCNIDRLFIYGDSNYAIGKSYSDYFESAYVLGSTYNQGIVANDSEINGLRYYCFADDENLGYTKSILDLKNCSLFDSEIFTNFKFLAAKMDTCTVQDLIMYGDSADFKTTEPEMGESDKYAFIINDSDCKNMVIQTLINSDFENYSETRVIQDLPGVLKAYLDTNTFDTCVIQTPDGLVSYNAKNIMDMTDDTIRSDAALVYDGDNARNSGALAYYLDHGDTKNRTYEWTVAHNDNFNISSITPAFVDTYCTDKIRTTDTKLPAYTRHIREGESGGYYCFSLPYTSDGAGEIIGTVERNGRAYKTKAADEYFPKTKLYVLEGEPISLETIKTPGYTLKYMTRNTPVSSEKITSDTANTEEYVHNSEVMPNHDVQIIGEWSGIHKVEVDPELKEWITLTPSCDGAVGGRTVRISAVVQQDASVLGRLYYCKYEKDSNNLWSINYENEYEISLDDMEFTMPDTDVCIFAERYSTSNAITKFRLGGTRGTIDNTDNTILVELEGNIDLTALVPDEIVISDGATISPAPDEAQDFTKPVLYTVTSQNGEARTYKVTVAIKSEGSITYAELCGVKGDIDEVNKTVTFLLDPSVDVTAVTPTIKWTGLTIEPDDTPQDFTNPVDYTITLADGTPIKYTFIVERKDTSKIIQKLNLVTDNGTALEVVIDDVTKTIRVIGEYGTDFSNIFIDGLSYYGDVISVQDHSYLNLTTSCNITVTDNTGSAYVYDVIAVEKPSPVKTINQFVMYGREGVIITDAANQVYTVVVTLPSKYDISDIAPDIISFTGKSITDAGVKKDFRKPVEYTVTAYDGTEVTYTVTVVEEG